MNIDRHGAERLTFFDPEVRDLVRSLFEGATDGRGIACQLIERRAAGAISLEVVEAAFEAQGWELPEQ